MGRSIGLWLVFCWLAVASTVQGQGLLVVIDPDQSVRLPRPPIIWPPYPPYPPHPRPRPLPPPPATYKISEIAVDARLSNQVAQVQVSQAFVNTGSRPLEVSFVFPLPYDGAVDSLTLLVDGKEYPAQLLPAEKARALYESIVRKNKDPALLEWMGTGLFKTNVFPVPPGAKRTVTLTYSQLLRMQDGLTDFLFPLSTAKYTSEAVDKISFRVTLETADDLKNIYSPTYEVKVKRSGDRRATVTYTAEKELPTSDFRLFYDLGRGNVSTRVLSYRPDKNDDGYFLLLATPKIQAKEERLPPKTAVFVVDRSGSMSGAKIEQARGALESVLGNLRKGDLFNVIAYDSAVESFRPELQRYDEKTRAEALGFVEGIYAGGSTNIDEALRTALGQLNDSKRPSYVIFLTDGLPTAGETDESQIVQRAKEANNVRARIFSLGVGYDVNSRLLDKLVRENFGQSEYVRPDENIEDRVSRLYRRIEAPVLTDVALEFTLDEQPGRAKPVNRVYPKGAFDLFAGEQLVMVGRYRASGDAKVVVKGAIRGKQQTYDFPAKLVNKSDDQSLVFIEKLWAVRRVGEILDELDLKGKNQELIEELVKLSTRHGILTPYTSFLADENTSVTDLARNASEAGHRLGALESVSGASGFAQRAYKGALQQSLQASPPAAPRMSFSADAAMPGAGGLGGYGGGGYGRPAGPASGRAARQSAPAAAAAPLAAADAEIAQAAGTVRQIGSRTFYRRNAQWIDSTATEEQQKHAVRVKQFSEEYFRLARLHGREFAQYLVFDEPVVVNVADRTYLVEP
ncbi:MAG: VWA domain-containing protein [Pirellulaceae bacterium]|nr:VIT and VWA domain-containing protein [Thermoguttaceae bacterium]NLZ01586.1 VWA domain-containing protein [Pirellulaceae bacterium]